MSLISQNQREVWHRGYTTADVVEALLVSYTSSGEKLRIVNTVVTDPRLMPVCLLPWIGWDGCLPPPPSSFVVGGGREEELLVRTCYSFYTYICLTLPCTPTRRHLLHTIPAPLQRPWTAQEEEPREKKKKNEKRRRRKRENKHKNKPDKKEYKRGNISGNGGRGSHVHAAAGCGYLLAFHLSCTDIKVQLN